jgi:peptide/nickel transport system substrate-binding protein
MVSHTQHLARSVIALAAVVSVLVIAGCGSGSAGTSPADSTESWVTSTPAGSGAVDSITWNLPYGEPDTLDYLQAESPSNNTVLANLCESLIHLGPKMNYEPGLAESWESPNPTTFVYNLRPGLKFSDGKPVTTEDAIYSLDRNRNPTLGSFWEPWFENVKSIETTGANQITVKLSKPDALFNQFLATAGGVVAEKPYIEKAGKKYGTSEGGVMCVGPYQMAKWIPGKEIVITANPNYWQTAQRPKVKTIDYRFVTNNQTATDALLSGEIDGSYETPLTSWRTLTTSGSGHGYLGRSTGYTEINFSEKAGPVKQVDFRRALSLALNKEAIAKTIYDGTAQAIRSEFFPSTWGYAQDVYKKGYEALPSGKPNLAEAKELTAKVTGLRTVTLLSNSDEEAAKQLAAYIQSQAKKVGISIKLEELPSAQYISAEFDQKQFNHYDMALSTAGYLDIAEPLEMGVLSLTAGAVFNSLGYDNPSVSKWVAEAREALDPTKRAELMVKVQDQAFAKDVVSIPLVNWAERVFMNSRISGAAAAMTPTLYSPWTAELGATK